MIRSRTPRISVVVPILNGAAEAKDLVAALDAQTFAQEAEVLFVDNGSEDGTPEVLGELAGDRGDGRLLLRVLTEGEVQSSYAARNRGVRHARAPLVAFLDADCLPAPDWLERLAASFQDPAVGVAAGGVQPLPGVSWLEVFAEQEGFVSQEPAVSHAFLPYGQTANLAVRMEVLRRVGLFRPALDAGGDADLCWRAQTGTGFRFIYEPRARVSHRSRSRLADYRRQWERYGRGARYLSELYSVDTPVVFERRLWKPLVRWIFAELPPHLLRVLRGRQEPVRAFRTPLLLYTGRAFRRGLAQATLTEEARRIEWLKAEPLPRP